VRKEQRCIIIIIITTIITQLLCWLCTEEDPKQTNKQTNLMIG